MKYIHVMFIVFVFSIYKLNGERKYYPTLPVGAYKMKFKGAFICNDSVHYLIHLKFHVSRVTEKQTMLLGNITTLIPLDDSLNFHANLAVLDHIGGWKDNAYVYSHPKACSSLKFLMGETWTELMRNFKFKSTDCPLPKGIHIMEGFDLALCEKMNIPKQFFYGTYKMKIKYTDKNDVVVGCFIIVIEILRPWEYV